MCIQFEIQKLESNINRPSAATLCLEGSNPVKSSERICKASVVKNVRV